MADEYTRDQNILRTVHFFIDVIIRAAIALLQYFHVVFCEEIFSSSDELSSLMESCGCHDAILNGQLSFTHAQYINIH